MPKNRVERLEDAVSELASTVEGLTGELVEAKERIRTLEAEIESEAPTPETDDGTREAAPDEVEAATADAVEGSEDSSDTGTDEIIIA